MILPRNNGVAFTRLCAFISIICPSLCIVYKWDRERRETREKRERWKMCVVAWAWNSLSLSTFSVLKDRCGLKSRCCEQFDAPVRRWTAGERRERGEREESDFCRRRVTFIQLLLVICTVGEGGGKGGKRRKNKINENYKALMIEPDIQLMSIFACICWCFVYYCDRVCLLARLMACRATCGYL